MRLKYSGLLLAFLILPTQLLKTTPNDSFKKGIAVIGGAGIIAAVGIYAYKKMTEPNNSPKKKSFLKQASEKIYQALIFTKKICATFFEELLKELSKNENEQVSQINCGICLEESQDFTTLVCKHQYCRECLEQIVDMAIKEKNTAQLKCPNPECNQAISPEDVRKITNNSQEKVNALAEITTREWLIRQPNAKQCPTPNCPYIFLNDEDNKQLIKCPQCDQEYCSQCLIKHPNNTTCEQAHGMRPSDRPSAEWLQQNTKRCPKCAMLVQRDGGCLYITCRQCKTPFCFNCLDPQHHVFECNKKPVYNHNF